MINEGRSESNGLILNSRFMHEYTDLSSYIFISIERAISVTITEGVYVFGSQLLHIVHA